MWTNEHGSARTMPHTALLCKQCLNDVQKIFETPLGNNASPCNRCSDATVVSTLEAINLVLGGAKYFVVIGMGGCI